MIQIDGSIGEGGGQILRTALGLSLVTGRPFHITNIRARRRKPGLMRQHLTAVRAAAEIGNAHLVGDEVCSNYLIFHPVTVQPGAYHFSIGTAGSCTLVMQTVLPALLLADQPSELVIEGGTHNPMAPPFDFLQTTFLPRLVDMGAKVAATLERPGFYPAGGGRVRIEIEPARRLKPLRLETFTHFKISAQVICAQLPEHIGRRELNSVKQKLEVEEQHLEIILIDEHGPGNTLNIFVHSDSLTETFTGFGQKNVRAEKVAKDTVKEVLSYLRASAPVGPYLADQLLIPMALAGSGSFRTTTPSKHTTTNMHVIQQFLDVEFTALQINEKTWEIKL
ncbi:MAG: RNA 3'-terminal phosphate cyclase [Desulforhopalus sp.]